MGLVVGVVAFCFFVWPLENGGGVDNPGGRATLETLALGAAVSSYGGLSLKIGPGL